jgi:hypothetical protein
MPLPELLIGRVAAHADRDGTLTDPALRASLVELVKAFATVDLRIDLRRAAASRALYDSSRSRRLQDSSAVSA